MMLNDSREVIARIEELREEWSEAARDDDLSLEEIAAHIGEDAAEELKNLIALDEEGRDNVSDWEYGEALIHDDNFVDYVRELVVDCGYLPADLPGWIHIDWDRTAAEVRMDYVELDFGGETYLARM